MSEPLHPKEMEAVLGLSGQERYGYFIERVVEREEVWGLQNEEGWVLISFPEGDAFCLWPHADYARACTRGDWSDCAPEGISLDELIGELVPALQRDNLRLAIFPTPAGEAMVVDSRDLQEHLESAFAQLRSHDQ
ncbi:MAG TPA: DUF2750 domain-containing protein [Acidobacteria bacterium]|nr:DUF2750 domain-containing protein [Acidobacteriota bacterium]